MIYNLSNYTYLSVASSRSSSPSTRSAKIRYHSTVHSNPFSICFQFISTTHSNSRLLISLCLFWWPWKGPVGVPGRQVSGRASSGSLTTSCGQKVLHPQPPIACLVGRREMLLLLHHVRHSHDFGSLLVQFHLERWDNLVKPSVFFLKHSHPSFCVLVLVLRGEEWIASSHLFS